MKTNQNPTPNPSTEGNQLDISQPGNSHFSKFSRENTLYKQCNPEFRAPPYSRCVGNGGSPSWSLVIKLSCSCIWYRLPGGHWEISRLGHNTLRRWLILHNLYTTVSSEFISQTQVNATRKLCHPRFWWMKKFSYTSTIRLTKQIRHSLLRKCLSNSLSKRETKKEAKIQEKRKEEAAEKELWELTKGRSTGGWD